MPTRKTSKETPEDNNADKLPENEVEKSDSDVKDSIESVRNSGSKEKSDEPSGQLFFSTDGAEPEKKDENVFDDDISKTENAEANQTKDDSSDSRSSQGKRNIPNANPKSGNANPNQQGHGNKGFKKPNWQDKKNPKNKPRPKFKKPKKLPYEDTESKALEIGNLLEYEDLKTEEGVSSLAEVFAASDCPPILHNDLYSLALPTLKEKISELSLEIEMPPAPIREEIFDILFEACLKKSQPIEVSAIIEVMEAGHGFLLHETDNYRLKAQSPFVPECLIKKYGLKTGHLVKGFIRPKMEGSTCPILVQVDKVMGGAPEEASRIMPFTELVPYYPLDRIYLETNADAEWDNVSMRVVDLVSPIGLGQRGLIVAPPRTGKTVLQQAIARSLRVNNPQAHLIVLLVDERPEEVTDFRRQVPDSEVIASTFDESAQSHVHAAEIVIEKARRMVECGQDVVILLDSITRLARAYNTTMPNSGKILSGGVEATALQRPKRFFGSARNIEGGGSLTILGTALVETGSKMDEVIFEEFKGTGNMELHLDRELSNKRIFPALDFEKSGTRKEELLYHPDELNKIYSLRRSLKGVPPVEAMEMFIQRVRKTKNNPEFLMGLGR